MKITKTIIIGLILIFTLSSCSINKNDVVNNNGLFEKRLKCNSLKNQIKKEVIDEESNTMFVTMRNDKNNPWTYDELNDVFFSERKQSCLYIIESTYPRESKLKTTYDLYDYFTKAYIDNCAYGKNSRDNYVTEEFWRNVKQLKS